MIDKKIWKFIEEKIDENVVKIGKGYPSVTVEGKYSRGDSYQQRAGFWPGILWKAYQVTENETYAMLAREIEADLDQNLKDTNRVDQYNGRIWTLVSLADYKLTGDQEAKRRALLAANLLLARFNLAGDYLRWGNDYAIEEKGLVLIDSVIDTPLLFWAAEETGDPRFRHVAEAHLTTIIDSFIQEDGSLRTACLFNPETGEFVEETKHPELLELAEGIAYAQYGFALAARYTRRPEYLDASKLLAEQLSHQTDENNVSLLSLPATIAANGWIVLAKLTGRKEYREQAEKVITDLFERNSTKNKENQGMIFENNGEREGSSFVEGDYFFTEAVVSLLFDKDLFW